MYEKEITFIMSVTLVYMFVVGVFYQVGIQLEADPILFVMPAMVFFMLMGAKYQLKNNPIK